MRLLHNQVVFQSCVSKGVKNSVNPSQERTIGVIIYANVPFPYQGNLVPLQQSLGTRITSPGHRALENHHQGRSMSLQSAKPPPTCIHAIVREVAKSTQRGESSWDWHRSHIIRKGPLISRMKLLFISIGGSLRNLCQGNCHLLLFL